MSLLDEVEELANQLEIIGFKSKIRNLIYF